MHNIEPSTDANSLRWYYPDQVRKGRRHSRTLSAWLNQAPLPLLFDCLLPIINSEVDHVKIVRTMSLACNKKDLRTFAEPGGSCGRPCGRTIPMSSPTLHGRTPIRRQAAPDGPLAPASARWLGLPRCARFTFTFARVGGIRSRGRATLSAWLNQAPLRSAFGYLIVSRWSPPKSCPD